MALVLLLGGARSGKSAMAVRLASDSQAPVTFIATASAGDDEMAERIRRHRESRPAVWKTVEAALDVLGPIRATAAGEFIVIDCLTLWVANLLGEGAGAAEIESAAAEMLRALRARDCVVVTNEVGLGIVPDNALARSYRDTLGRVNAEWAALADEAYFVVAGRPLRLA